MSNGSLRSTQMAIGCQTSETSLSFTSATMPAISAAVQFFRLHSSALPTRRVPGNLIVSLIALGMARSPYLRDVGIRYSLRSTVTKYAPRCPRLSSSSQVCNLAGPAGSLSETVTAEAPGVIATE